MHDKGSKMVNLHKPDSGMHSLPNIRIGVSLDRLEDGNIVALPQLLNVQRAYKQDDTISCRGTM